MSESVIKGSMDLMKSFGIFDLLIPFLLGFGITFGMLEKTQLFNNQKVNAVIAFAVGMAAVLAWNGL